MSSVLRAINRERTVGDAVPTAAFSGVVSRDVSDMGERAWAVVPAINTEVAVGPCRWQARDDSSHPSRGDSCLMLFDDTGEPWIVAWWPFST